MPTSSSARRAAARPPVLGQVRMLEEQDVVVGARGGDRVPDGVQRLLAIERSERDLEDADVVRRADLGVLRQRRGELPARLVVARRPAVEHQHRDSLSSHARAIPGAVLA